MAGVSVPSAFALIKSKGWKCSAPAVLPVIVHVQPSQLAFIQPVPSCELHRVSKPFRSASTGKQPMLSKLSSMFTCLAMPLTASHSTWGKPLLPLCPGCR
jgi:hypothetical protein